MLRITSTYPVPQVLGLYISHIAHLKMSAIMDSMLVSAGASASLGKPRFSSVTAERDWLAAENKALREEIKQLLAALQVHRDLVSRLSVKQEAA